MLSTVGVKYGATIRVNPGRMQSNKCAVLMWLGKPETEGEDIPIDKRNLIIIWQVHV